MDETTVEKDHRAYRPSFFERFAGFPRVPEEHRPAGGPATRGRWNRAGRLLTSRRRMKARDDNHIRKQWKVEVSIDEHDGRTRAIARLHWCDRVSVGTGFARCHPSDRDIADIGDELAVARALADLSLRVQTVARRHIESVTGEPVTRL